MADNVVILFECRCKPRERTVAVTRVTVSVDDHVPRKPSFLGNTVHDFDYLSNEGLTSPLCIRTLPLVSLLAITFQPSDFSPVFEGPAVVL